MIKPSNRLRAAGLALVVTFLWSTSWVLIRRVLDDDQRVPPITFAGLRYGLAAIVVLAWMSSGSRRGSIRAIDGPALRRLVLLGAVMYGVTQGAQFVAIDSQPAATTNLVLAMTPLAVALSSAAFLDEPTTGRQRAGGAVIVLGAAAYFAGDLGATAVGVAAALTGLAANAAASLLGRSVNRTTALTSGTVTAVSMSVGAALLIATGLAVDGVPRPGTAALVVIAWLAVVNTALAFTWWNRSLRTLTATESAAINTTMAVQIPILGWIFLDEPLGLPEIAGISMVVAGVLAMRSARRQTLS